MSNLYIKCSVCHRDKINYSEGNFFLITFKPEKNQNNDNLKIIQNNQKWFCDLHYKDYVHLKNLSWSKVFKQ